MQGVADPRREGRFWAEPADPRTVPVARPRGVRGGVLIPAKYLVNGLNIVQVPVDAVEYHHIELAAHDVILAEGLPAESYLETGNRRNFENADGVVRLFPDFAQTTPRGRTGRRLVAHHSA